MVCLRRKRIIGLGLTTEEARHLTAEISGGSGSSILVFFYIFTLLSYFILLLVPYIVLPPLVCSHYSILFSFGSAYALIMLGFIFSRVDGSAYALMVPGKFIFYPG